VAAVFRGGGAVEREERKEGRGVERRRCSSFIGRRGKGRRRGEAVAVARRWRPLMAAAAALDRATPVGRVREARGSEKGSLRGS
jgi:hypothetical protein